MTAPFVVRGSGYRNLQSFGSAQDKSAICTCIREAIMRYLVTVDYVDATAPLSSQQLLQLIEQAGIPTLEACAKLEAEQKILAGGVAARTGSGIMIVEASSHEDLNQLVQRLPAWGALQVAVTPLQSFAERAAQDRQAIERQRASSGQHQRAINEHLGQLRDQAGG